MLEWRKNLCIVGSRRARYRQWVSSRSHRVFTSPLVDFGLVGDEVLARRASRTRSAFGDRSHLGRRAGRGDGRDTDVSKDHAGLRGGPVEIGISRSGIVNDGLDPAT